MLNGASVAIVQIGLNKAIETVFCVEQDEVNDKLHCRLFLIIFVGHWKQYAKNSCRSAFLSPHFTCLSLFLSFLMAKYCRNSGFFQSSSPTATTKKFVPIIDLETVWLEMIGTNKTARQFGKIAFYFDQPFFLEGFISCWHSVEGYSPFCLWEIYQSSQLLHTLAFLLKSLYTPVS